MSAPGAQGVALFVQQLRDQGYEAAVDDTWAIFSFIVPGGTFQGNEITMAINVPCDFPITPPPGIEFGPRFESRPVNPGGEHPARSHVSSKFPQSGEYWSRPHPRWNEEKVKSAQAYMAWVTHLWMTT
jgi:hypothetical protein